MNIYCLIPDYCQEEIRYSVEYVLERLFFCNVKFESHKEDKIELHLENKKTLIFSVDFFSKSNKSWLKRDSLPSTISYYSVHPCLSFGIEDGQLPIIFGQPMLSFDECLIECEFDLFGTVFFYLSRYEEGIDGVDLDAHHRFPASSSFSYQVGLLECPIVDQYIKLIDNIFKVFYPDIVSKKTTYNKFVTCDVDWPLSPERFFWKKMFSKALSLLIKKKSPKKSFLVVSNFILTKLGFLVHDQFKQEINWIMDENERVGNKVAFFFIPLNTDRKYDPNFNFDSREVRDILKDISVRGHEIGIHPGYRCFDNPLLFRESVNKMRTILLEEGIAQGQFGGRMHFLRWDARLTPKLWSDNGLIYDSTLSFADKSGFRCGTCHPFPMYDLVNRCKLNIIQRPLTSMESTIISSRYENLGYTHAAIQRFDKFKNIVLENEGEYVLLWHNSHFSNYKDKEFYKKLIE